MDQPNQAATTPADDQSLTPGAAAQRGIGRRALLRGGAVAAPVLLTLHSGPVAATGNMACTVASSFVSVATFASRNAGATTMQCSTMNAGHWHAQAKLNAGYAPERRQAWATMKLQSYLGRTCSALPGLTGRPEDYQIWQVMSIGNAPAGTGELGVLHHILGLALSIDHGGNAVNTGGRMTTAYLAGIWQTYKTTGRYHQPIGNIDWTEAQLVSWLKMLQYPIPVPRA